MTALTVLRGKSLSKIFFSDILQFEFLDNPLCLKMFLFHTKNKQEKLMLHKFHLQKNCWECLLFQGRQCRIPHQYEQYLMDVDMYQTEAPGTDFLQNHHISLYFLFQGYQYFFNVLCHFDDHFYRFVRCAINLHLPLDSLFPSFHLFEHFCTKYYSFLAMKDLGIQSMDVYSGECSVPCK